MGNMGINSVGIESVFHTRQAGRTECLTSVSREALTRETQLSSFGLTLRILARAGHMILCGMLNREIPAKSSSVSKCLSLHTILSIIQPLQ